ncbi:MAG: 8-oxo-dGTP diphosphatase [Sphaerochaetaceae bacterium]|jgi:8-oxo-dGTP diphosphatase|nr:8-oxo-dGTP diphosphatase [Sphaerochaetaceae bacterium]NLY06925.1 8-oxo-dGTP diphosphatase [Spirochaetales bacterium]
MTFHAILEKTAENYLWFLLAILIINLQQKRYMPRCNQKRMATLFLAMLALLFEIGLALILAKAWSDWLVFVVLAIVLAIAIVFRNRCWPFRLHCPKCGASLKFQEIIGSDGNICDECYKAEHPEEFAEPEIEKPEIPTSVTEIDWDNWEAAENCVITYLFRTDENGKRQVLLIDKKTGLGKGLVNAPGGHIEPEETAVEAAIREYKEETDLDIANPQHVGTLHFQFLDGNTLLGHVYFCEEFKGTIKETDEARGFWCPVSEIPYSRMWEDDRFWLPEALEGMKFSLVSIFDDEKLLSMKVVKESCQK